MTTLAELMANDPQWNAPDGWTTYFHTTDVGPPRRILRLLQPTGHRGFEVVNANGAPAYFQFTTRYGKALDFYRTRFDRQIETVSDTDEFRNSTAMFDWKRSSV